VALARLEQVRRMTPAYLRDFERARTAAGEWRHDQPYGWLRSIGAFFFGTEWVTNSSWHDFYGLLPLLTGSVLISLIALTVAVPFSVGAAIYVNQLAHPAEQHVIKPAIEFVQAIPSIVLGFFGIMVLGTFLREASELEWLSWVPGFPMQERLNILNAGLLLALMAVPTIFTLSEDALNNVPQAMTEASLAVGASKLQTIVRVVFPAAVSGILAAILLGLGRVIGETMVVLLVAGNQIAIPDFSLGLGVVTEPAHTMTGIIAQETGEVDQGSLHWRALFMVGLVLFTISLGINWTAQKIIQRLQLA
jgi:phosphate transport system permease protein